MKVSKAVGYALRALAYLANNGKGRKVTLHEISKAEDIPVTYLVKVMKRLEGTGLVTIFRGSVGGYALTKAPAKVNMLEVYEAIEGRLMLRDCTDHPQSCGRAKKCPTRPVWVELQDRVRDAFEECRLSELKA